MFLFVKYLCTQNILLNVMKEQTNKIHENLKEGKEAYEAPKCEIIEMQNEGVLCGSASNESFTENPWGGSWD